MNKLKTRTIELDCEPFSPRPDTLLPRVLKDTGLSPKDFKIIGKSFGNWTFELKSGYITSENGDPIIARNLVYEQGKDKIKERVKRLYNTGAIRYGSW